MDAADDLASELLSAERSGVPVSPPSERVHGLSIADAYAVQRAGLRLRAEAGAVLVGRKVGLTSRAMQELLGVEQPDFGYLTSAMVSESGAVLDADRFVAPRAEVEIAFRLGAPLEGAALDVADVLAATEAVAPAIEVIDSRVADWRIAIADTVADNASSGHVVLGAWRPLGDLLLPALEARLVVARPGGADEAVEGRGDAVLGDPARAVAWLARALDEYGGERIEAGEIVLSGAMARALPVGPGNVVHATVGTLGAVATSFAAGARRS